MCCDHVEGGLYIGPEFQLGQVYDGGMDNNPESVLLYRPVYACIPNPKLSHTPAARARLMVEQPEGGSMRAGSVGASSRGVRTASMSAGTKASVGGSTRGGSVSGTTRTASMSVGGGRAAVAKRRGKRMSAHDPADKTSTM